MQEHELIPDFDELEELAEKASQAKSRSISLDHQIKALEAQYIVEALNHREYWQEGKKPTITYCDKVVRQIGNTEEERERLAELREEQSNQEELYHYYSSLIEIRRDKLALYRTESANKRKAFLS